MDIRATLDEESKNVVGWILMVAGALFTLAGILLFVFTNKDNVFAQKTTATITNRYIINQKEGTTFEDEQRYILDLAYRVGEEMVFASCRYTGVLNEREVNIDIYYNIKNPDQIMIVEWSFEPVVLFFIGLLFLAPGLYYTQIFSFGIKQRKKPGPQSSEAKIKLYEAGEKIENNAIPLGGSVVFLLGGILMKVLGSGWWTLSFMIIGALGIVYFALGLFPAMAEYRNYSLAVKSKVVKKDDLLEKK